ncbi:MAG: hypothetical protein QOJ92_431 [Frankiales bacterium]|nr:hypothetical protein [Frankiales bacterium]
MLTPSGDAIGFVGLGVMGSAMAERLIRSGHPISVYNRDHRKAERLAMLGATVVDDPGELASRSTLIIGCLLDTDAVQQVYLRDGGIIARLRPGSMIVEHGTFAPWLARAASDAAASRGIAFLDAPVTGGPEGAASGTLTIMVGGDQAAFDQVSPVLSTYAEHCLRVGGSGSGVALKLVNQLLVTCHLSAAAEAAALIEAFQLDPAVSQQVLNSGWAASAMLARSLPLVAAGSLESAGATVGGLLEVQRLVREMTTEHDLDLATFAQACQMFQAAAAAGWANHDPASLVEVLRAGGASAVPDSLGRSGASALEGHLAESP